MRAAQALREGIARLTAAGVPEAAGDARRLLAQALGAAPDRLTLHMQDLLQPSDLEGFFALIDRRTRREPVSHLVGERMFWGRRFRVTPAVLDPRPETETLVACALEQPFGHVLDLGTGSGCILVTLLAERSEAKGLGVDLSPEALAVASENARRHGVEGRARWQVADWYPRNSDLPGWDLIVSNPPYIPVADLDGLEPEVRCFEPRLALTDEGDGLGAYRTILGHARDMLRRNGRGRVAVEVGAGQAAAVLAIGEAAGLERPETRRDMDGRERVCLFRSPL